MSIISILCVKVFLYPVAKINEANKFFQEEERDEF
jgi:hypothetical protein